MTNTKKRTFTVEVSTEVLKTLDKYGFDYGKNIQEMLEEVAYYIWLEESNKGEEDIGTSTVKEMRLQNNE